MDRFPPIDWEIWRADDGKCWFGVRWTGGLNLNIGGDPQVAKAFMQDVLTPLLRVSGAGHIDITNAPLVGAMLDKLFTEELASASGGTMRGVRVEPAPAQPTVLAPAAAPQATVLAAPAATASSTPTASSGAVDDFEIEQELGRGAFGVVSAVKSRVTGVRFAMKALQIPDDDDRRMFLDELLVWFAAPDHPNLTRCHFFRSSGDKVYLFTDLAERGSLAGAIASGALYQTGATYEDGPQPRVLDVAIQTARGLAALHAESVVHLDVKPQNVLLSEAWDARITDLGLAATIRARPSMLRAAQEAAVNAQTVAPKGYTPAYAAPEHSSTQVSLAADVFSWGVMVLELYLGEATWMIGSAAPEVLEAVRAREQKTRIRLPPGIRDLLARALAIAPEARPSMSEIVTVLESEFASLFRASSPRPSPPASPRYDLKREMVLQSAGGQPWALSDANPALLLERAVREAGLDPALAKTLLPRHQASRRSTVVADLIVLGTAERIFGSLVAAGRTNVGPALAEIHLRTGFILAFLDDVSGALAAYTSAIQIASKHSGLADDTLKHALLVRGALLLRHPHAGNAMANAQMDADRGLALGGRGRLTIDAALSRLKAMSNRSEPAVGLQALAKITEALMASAILLEAAPPGSPEIPARVQDLYQLGLNLSAQSELALAAGDASGALVAGMEATKVFGLLGMKYLMQTQPEFAAANLQLAACYRALGKLSEARVSATDAGRLFRALVTDGRWECVEPYGTACSLLAAILVEKKRPAEAIPFLDDALAILSEAAERRPVASLIELGGRLWLARASLNAAAPAPAPRPVDKAARAEADALLAVCMGHWDKVELVEGIAAAHRYLAACERTGEAGYICHGRTLVAGYPTCDLPVEKRYSLAETAYALAKQHGIDDYAAQAKDVMNMLKPMLPRPK